jgi:transcriptional regulator with XRE-family HTH domain
MVFTINLRETKARQMESFGRMIANRRKARDMTLADLTQQILKADGNPISIPYLGTLEQGRCNPSSGLIPQFAAALDMPEDILYFALGRLPPDIHGIAQASHQNILVALQMVRKILLSPDAEQLQQGEMWSLILSQRQFRFGFCQQAPSFASSGFSGGVVLPLGNSTGTARGSIAARKRATLLRARQEPYSQTA